MNKKKLKTALDRFGLPDLKVFKDHIESLMTQKRAETAPSVQEVVFDLILQSGMKPQSFGFHLMEGTVIKPSPNYKPMEAAREPVFDVSMKELQDMPVGDLEKLLEDVLKAERKEKQRVINEYRVKIWKVLRGSKIDPASIGLRIVDKRYMQSSKFKDPATGKTWAGRGKTPNWLREFESQGRNRDEFLDREA